MRAIQIRELGGPEVLDVVDVPEPAPGDDRVLIDVTTAGVNYADTHQSQDSYLASTQLPFVPGSEIVGTDPDGRRVVALPRGGGYAERAAVDPAACYPVPDDVDDATAAAVALQGTSAWHLLHTCARIRPGESVVIFAAAGGVGSLAVQLARVAGAEPVIAAASTQDKRDLAGELGAHATIDSTAADLTTAIREAAGGRVDVVLEMTGGDTFDQSLAAVAPFGRLVTYGMASGEAPSDIKPARLLRRSQTVAGFWLAHAFADPPRLIGEPLAALFSLVADGQLRPVIGGVYPLTEARRAHEDLLARRSVGKLLLDPSR